jgi:hypothetical protein
MTCSEDALAAFLAGELTEDEERELDRHLITCEACWDVVQRDRYARQALAYLQEPAPAYLEERVRLAVHDAAPAPVPLPRRVGGLRHNRAGRQVADRRPRPFLAAAAAAAAVVVGLVGWAAWPGPTRQEPAQLAAVVAMMDRGGPGVGQLRAGERMEVAHQSMTVKAYRVHGQDLLVATSGHPFPVPAGSRPLPGRSRTWTATSGRLSMYGVNHPSGTPSMFVVAAMPVGRLPAVAAALHLS